MKNNKIQLTSNTACFVNSPSLYGQHMIPGVKAELHLITLDNFAKYVDLPEHMLLTGFKFVPAIHSIIDSVPD